MKRIQMNQHNKKFRYTRWIELGDKQSSINNKPNNNNNKIIIIKLREGERE